MNADELDFHLPPELIAQSPSPDRAASRLLHYRRADRSIEHRTFSDLPSLLQPGDLLVFNDARVTPARFLLVKPTGGHVEGLFLGQTHPRRWQVLLKNLGRAADQPRLVFADDPGLGARVVDRADGGQYTLEFDDDTPAEPLLERLGRMPLPPYIRRDKAHDPRDEIDRERYQTVYAAVPGSVAAPTAGLHFTPSLLQELDRRGVRRAFLTLHVGLGTFKPISTDRVEDHVMHVERYTLPPAAAEAIAATRAAGGRVIAVGTTSARVLESQPTDRPIAPVSGETGIFIRPPYAWRHVDALITNFHLPRSTLIALVAALVSLDEQRRMYAEAIERRYRFFSYGDAMLVE